MEGYLRSQWLPRKSPHGPQIKKAATRQHMHVNPNRDSPNGYPTATPTELQPVTLAH